jgi:hypothetical protein
MSYENVLEMNNELNEYIELEGSELGEVCGYLVSISHYWDYLSKGFQKSLELEIKSHLKYFKKNCKIVERPVEKVVTTIRELEWNE